jgi:hypothetical protein
MTTTELLNTTRRWLGDESTPYKWSTVELIDYYNYAMDFITRETDYFEEASLAAIIHVTLTAGTPDYAFDARVLQIRNARLIGESVNLSKRTYAELQEETNTWRYIDSVTGTDISFDATLDTIDATSSDLSVFSTDNYIEVTGSTSNNETFLIDTAISTSLAVDTTFNPIPLTEVVGDQVIIKSLNTGTPTKYCVDYRQGYITLVPCPEEAGVLFIECIRKQLTPLTASNYTTETIPINVQYHLQLTDGILSKAFLKGSPGTFNIEKANVHSGIFIGLKETIKRDLIKLKAMNTTTKPHNGCM